ncbi:MAG: Tm-1-like ATP-binding domain-containing protein [Akkermansiaceae bacterium]|nr:Tm-1-like ATP-binding domain-containing protein [Akkermansiaceae bacterium]
MATIGIVGTLDSKGEEHAFLAERIREQGHDTLLIDVGTGGDPQVAPDVTRFEVAEAGGIDLQPLIDKHDRGECVVAMSEAAPVLVARLAAEGKIDGIISLGGGGGTALGTAAMRALPLGFPKLMVSTLASGNTAHYLRETDIAMMPSIVDVAGLNRISRMVFTRAAGAICGMVDAKPDEGESKPLVVASMFGNTTTCIEIAKKVIEAEGYEVLVFHATGTGGKTMEKLIASGMVSGVLDVTTTEWADELVGATLSAGPERLEAAGKAGVPAVVAPGCLDMANFGERESVPEQFEGRNFYIHNPQVTLMRTNATECADLGRIVAEKVNAYQGPAEILIPKGGISVISREGEPFHDAEADAALFGALREHAKVPVHEFDGDINSEEFAEAAAKRLLALMNSAKAGS